MFEEDSGTVKEPIKSPQEEIEKADEATTEKILGKKGVMPKKAQVDATEEYQNILNSFREEEDEQNILSRIEEFKTNIEKNGSHPEKEKYLHNLELLSKDFLKMKGDFQKAYENDDSVEGKKAAIDNYLRGLGDLRERIA